MRSGGPTSVLLLAGLLGLAVACDPGAEAAREAWLQTTLIRDNQPFFERDPELGGGKMAKMGRTSYAYFRGTAPQYGRDLTQPGSPGYLPSDYLGPESADVALVGDPHPENVGTMLTPDGHLIIEFNDFDGATFGPYISDVRRLAVGFWVACEQARALQSDAAPEPLSVDTCAAAARAVPLGYAGQIVALAADGGAGPVIDERVVLEGGSFGTVADELLEKGREKGDEGSKLLDYTAVEDGARRMVFAEIEPGEMVAFGDVEQFIHSDRTIELTALERSWVDALMERYGESLELPVPPSQLVVKGVSRRLGGGVSSYPVPRFYILIEGPSESVEDDVLLEAKQVLDPVPLPGVPQFPGTGFTDNVTRITTMQRRLQGQNADRWLGGAMVGGLALKVRHRTGYQRGFGVDRLQEQIEDGDWLPEDLVVFAELSGRLLARNHAGAPKLDGAEAARPIASAIGDDAAGFVQETVTFVEAYGPRIQLDHALLRGIIADHGSLLGYRGTNAP